jgi:hypothetical protein
MKHASIALAGSLALALLLGSCAQTSTTRATAQPGQAAQQGQPELAGWTSYGAGVSTGPALTTSELLARANELEGQTVRVEDEAAEVCLRKGCWLLLREGEESVRITFKDYAFFVPLDCAGQRVRVEGVFAVEQSSAGEVRHYLEDAGKFDEAAKVTKPQRALKLVATGVAIAPAGS